MAVTTRKFLFESLIHPVVLMNGIVGYFVVFPAIYIVATGRFRFEYESPFVALAISLAILFGVYLVALFAFHQSDFTRYLSAGPRFDRRVANPYLLFWVGLGGFVVGLLFYLYYVNLNGGFGRLLTVTPRTAFQQIPNTGRYRLFGLLGVFGGFITILSALYPAIASPSREKSPLLWAVVGGASVITIAIAVSFRARMLILIPAAYLLVYLYTTDVITDRHFVVLGSITVFFGIAFTFIEHLLISSAGIWMLFEAAIHTARLQVFMVLVDRVPSQYPYQWGETFLRAILIGVDGGPLRYGEHLDIIATGKNRPGVTLSAMLTGEFYLNFGVIGALMSGVLYGLCLKFAYQLRTLEMGYLVNALYPVLLVGAVLLFPTNITFGVKAIGLRLLPPLFLSVLVVFLYQHHFKQWIQTEAKN
ncbi:oligosaccharide repeat unit polymerase [Haladaptatus halobius]|uniref:oligosaccharide repeat unit polymerase n=1 Tax=Haladaptatus halobius TaxID=2884875 RepID=UPI001D0BAC1B|nr:oligosaccharide repeat unit polymerase [Haladaptatus halobius]